MTAAELTCREFVELVTDYLEGRMAPADRARFEEHLAICPGCQTYVDQMRETLGYRARYTTAETFADFARSRGPGLVPPEALAGAIDRIAALPVPTVGGGQPPTQSAN